MGPLSEAQEKLYLLASYWASSQYTNSLQFQILHELTTSTNPRRTCTKTCKKLSSLCCLASLHRQSQRWDCFQKVGITKQRTTADICKNSHDCPPHDQILTGLTGFHSTRWTFFHHSLFWIGTKLRPTVVIWLYVKLLFFFFMFWV